MTEVSRRILHLQIEIWLSLIVIQKPALASLESFGRSDIMDSVAVGAELSLQIQDLCVLSIFHKSDRTLLPRSRKQIENRRDPTVSLRAGSLDPLQSPYKLQLALETFPAPIFP